MGGMFDSAGYSATTWSVTISPTNGDNISNTTSRMHGKTTSTSAEPLNGKAFTLAPIQDYQVTWYKAYQVLCKNVSIVSKSWFSFQRMIL